MHPSPQTLYTIRFSVCRDGWHNYHYLKRMVYSVCGDGCITIIIYSVWCIVFCGDGWHNYHYL